MNEGRKKTLDEARASLKRMQSLDPKAIARKNELGMELHFEAAVEPVQNVVNLFLQISPDVLGDFSLSKLGSVKQIADSEWNRIEQFRAFSVAQNTPKAARDAMITQAEQAYDSVFEQVWQMIAYSVRRATDFDRLEREARASVQAAADRTSKLEQELNERKVRADLVLQEIRKVAAEQGVSQHASYFKSEADDHSARAVEWLKSTKLATTGLGVYAFLVLVCYKIPIFAPKDAMEATQLVVGKSLLFLTIASFVVLSAKNYMAHRHNAIVNRHRQQSLATYKALVEAAGDSANRDIVLSKAADSIFGQQATGFTNSESGEHGALSMVSIGSSLTKGVGQ